MQSHSFEITTNSKQNIEQASFGKDKLLFLLKDNTAREKLIKFVSEINRNEYNRNDGFELIYAPKYDEHLIVASTNDLGKNQLGLYAGKQFESFDIVASFEGIKRFSQKSPQEIKEACKKYQGPGDYLLQIELDAENVFVIDALDKGSSGRFVNFANSANVTVFCIEGTIYYIATKTIEFGDEICLSYHNFIKEISFGNENFAFYAKNYFVNTHNKNIYISREADNLKNILQKEFPDYQNQINKIDNMKKLADFVGRLKTLEKNPQTIDYSFSNIVLLSTEDSDRSIKKRKINQANNSNEDLTNERFLTAPISEELAGACLSLLTSALNDEIAKSTIDNILTLNQSSFLQIFNWDKAASDHPFMVNGPFVLSKTIVDVRYLENLYMQALSGGYTKLVGKLFNAKYIIVGDDNQKYSQIKAVLNSNSTEALQELIEFKIEEEEALKWFINFVDKSKDFRINLNPLLICKRNIVRNYLKSIVNDNTFMNNLSPNIKAVIQNHKLRKSTNDRNTFFFHPDDERQVNTNYSPFQINLTFPQINTPYPQAQDSSYNLPPEVDTVYQQIQEDSFYYLPSQINTGYQQSQDELNEEEINSLINSLIN